MKAGTANEAFDLDHNVADIHNIDDALSTIRVAIWPAQGRCSKVRTWLK